MDTKELKRLLVEYNRVNSERLAEFYKRFPKVEMMNVGDFDKKINIIIKNLLIANDVEIEGFRLYGDRLTIRDGTMEYIPFKGKNSHYFRYIQSKDNNSKEAKVPDMFKDMKILHILFADINNLLEKVSQQPAYFKKSIPILYAMRIKDILDDSEFVELSFSYGKHNSYDYDNKIHMPQINVGENYFAQDEVWNELCTFFDEIQPKVDVYINAINNLEKDMNDILEKHDLMKYYLVEAI
jgi:hypothetical protein